MTENHICVILNNSQANGLAMQIKNTKTRFGIVTITLHWLMAILIIGLLCLVLYMTRIPISELKLRLFGFHKEYGMLVLMLAIVRLVWRLDNVNPSLSSLAPWEQMAARGMHWAFYGFMFAIPITGWLITSAAGLPVSFFDLFLLPDLVAANEAHRILFQTIHKWLSYGLIVAFCGHVGAALKHQFINKDDILRRIFP